MSATPRRQLTDQERWERLTPDQRQQPRTLRLALATESRISRADENARAESVRKLEDAERIKAAADRDARFAALAVKLACDADVLDKTMRAAGVDRDVYRQIGHAYRAARIAAKMLTSPN